MINLEDFDEITGEMKFKIDPDKLKEHKKNYEINQINNNKKKKRTNFILQIVIIIIIILFIAIFIYLCIYYRKSLFPQQQLTINKTVHINNEKLFLYTGLVLPNNLNIYSIQYPSKNIDSTSNITRDMLNVFTIKETQTFSFEIKIKDINELIIYRYPSNEIITSFTNKIQSKYTLSPGTYYILLLSYCNKNDVIINYPIKNDFFEDQFDPLFEINNDNIIKKMENNGYDLINSFELNPKILNKISNNLYSINSDLFLLKKDQFLVIKTNLPYIIDIKINGDINKLYINSLNIFENKNIDVDVSIYATGLFSNINENANINLYIFE